MNQFDKETVEIIQELQTICKGIQKMTGVKVDPLDYLTIKMAFEECFGCGVPFSNDRFKETVSTLVDFLKRQESDKTVLERYPKP